MNVAQHILVFGIRVYRGLISPAKTFVFGPLGQCRFTPSCSAYALESVRRHGALQGSWLGLKRICRCHPWGGCGHDPVPPVVARFPQSDHTADKVPRTELDCCAGLSPQTCRSAH